MSTSATKSTLQLFEEQRKRYQALQERHTRAQVRLEHERKALEDAKAEARSRFGTDDVDALRQKHKEMQEENDRLLMEFMMTLDDVEKKLQDLERQLAV